MEYAKKLEILKDSLVTINVDTSFLDDIGRGLDGNIDNLLTIVTSASKKSIIPELIKLCSSSHNHRITFNKKDAARILGVSQRKIDELRRANELKGISLSANNIGRKFIVYEKNELVNYIIRKKEEDELKSI